MTPRLVWSLWTVSSPTRLAFTEKESQGIRKYAGGEPRMKKIMSRGEDAVAAVSFFWVLTVSLCTQKIRSLHLQSAKSTEKIQTLRFRGIIEHDAEARNGQLLRKPLRGYGSMRA